jgi:hypothetical protein
MNGPVITMKKIIVALLLVGLLFVLILILNFSVLTITSASQEEKNIYIRSSSDSNVRNFTLKKGSKRLLLARETYTIEVSSGDKFSSYQKDLARLSGNKLEVELVSQKSEGFLGKTSIPCAKQTKDGVVLFYSCRQDNALTVLSDRQIPTEHHEEDAGDQNFSAALKSYGDDFIEAKSQNGKLVISLRDDRGIKPDIQPINLAGFNGAISDDTFSASPSGNFSAYDEKSASVWLFRGLSDQNPAKVKVDPKTFDEHANFTLVTGPNYTFLINMQSVEHTETGHEEKDIPSGDGLIIVIDNKQGKITKEEKLGSDLISREVVPGPSDNLMILLSGNLEGEARIYNLKLGLKKAGILPKGIQQACWKNGEQLYYNAEAGRAIYLYSVAKQASFLVYTNRTNFVSNLSCNGGQLYFALQSEKIEDSNLAHYTLGKEDQTGTRLSEVLPFYHTFNRDTFRLEENRTGVAVNLSYDSDKNGGASKDALKQKLVEFFKEKGVATEKLNFNFNY